MPLVQLDSGRLAYDEAGTGPPVILSHAAIADRRMWKHQFERLRSRFRVVRYDRMGFGESDDVRGEVDHAADLLALLDALHIETAALVGSSMGGGISVDAALAAPGRVSALALICSGLSGWRWPDEMRAEVRPLLAAAVPADRLTAYSNHTSDEVRDEDIDSDIAAMAEMQVRYLTVGPGRVPEDLGPAAWELALTMARRVFEREWRGPAYTERLPDPLPQDRLGEIAVPTLVIKGLADSPYLHELSDLLAERIPGAQRVDLPDTAHLAPIERPEQVSAELLGFLDSADS